MLAVLSLGATPGSLGAESAESAEAESVEKGVLEAVILKADPLTISLADGGSQTFSLDFGVEFAGAKFIIAGSKRGIIPGTMYGLVNVPLNYGSYSEWLLKDLGEPGFKSLSGELNEEGKGTAMLNVPISQDPELVGMVLYHAAILLEPKAEKVLKASNAIELILMP